MPDSQSTLIDKNTPEHDQPGDERGTHIQSGQGITNRPADESARQSKVVEDRQQPNPDAPVRG